MASIRKRLDEDILIKEDIEFFESQKGAVPLCCCMWKIADPDTGIKYPEPLLQCDQLEEPLPLSKFKPYCLKCQAYIEKKLSEKNG